MKKKAIIAIAALLTFGQVAWADGTPTKHFSGTINSGQQNEQNGSEGKPYHISSIEDLNHLAEDVNSGTKYKDVHFKLTANLNYSEVSLFDSDNDGNADSNFTPIGSCADEDEAEVGSFQGTFDGGCDNNCTISGIRVYQPTGTYIGLFGNSYGATIKNVRLRNCQFTGQAIVGGIVAAENSGTPNDIVNCHVEKTVEVTAIGTGKFGGFVGGIAGMYQYAAISNCSSSATVSGSQYVGGIVGLLTIEPAIGGNVSGCSSNDVMVGRVWIVGDSNEYIALTNDADNSNELSAYNNQTDNVILLGRTLSKSEWNTLCLPFSMDADQIAASSLNGATIKELEAGNSDLTADSILTLKFTVASSTTAGTPYIVKWDGASGTVSNPVFAGVTINATAPTAVKFANNANTYGDCEFVGQYSPFSIVASGAMSDNEGNLNEIIMLGSGNSLGYSKSAGRTLKCFRAHFYVPANPANGIAGARAFVMDFGDGESTGIIDMTADQRSADGATYTLDGRKLCGMPATKGVYIQNGRKVIIK